MEKSTKSLIPPTMVSLFPPTDCIIGLTGSQKCTIYAAWQLIKKDFQIHSRNIFAMFYERFPEYLKYFNSNEILHSHSLAVFESLSLLIERGFNDVSVYEHHFNELLKIHPNIRGSDVRRISDVIIEYLLQTVEKQRTQTLDIALNVFFDHICYAFDGNKDAHKEPLKSMREENLIEQSTTSENENESEENVKKEGKP